MGGRVWLAAGLLWAGLAPVQAGMRIADRDALASVFFPQADGWVDVAEQPSLTPAQARKLLPQIAAAEKKGGVTADGISISESLKGEALDSAHWIDLDADGADDILFAGFLEGTEIIVTAGFFSRDGGFTAARAEAPEDVFAMRVRPEAEDPEMVSITAAPGDVTLDSYHLGTLSDAASGETIAADMFLEVPEDVLAEPEDFTATRAIELRRGPKQDVLRRYGAGAAGRVLAREGGWAFVVVSAESRELVRQPDEFDYAPEDAGFAGWVRADVIN